MQSLLSCKLYKAVFLFISYKWDSQNSAQSAQCAFATICSEHRLCFRKTRCDVPAHKSLINLGCNASTGQPSTIGCSGRVQVDLATVVALNVHSTAVRRHCTDWYEI